MRHWHPIRWKRFSHAITRVKEGDVIHNPVYADDTSESRRLAQRVDDALAEMGLKLDHTHTCIGFVVRGEFSP